jgi:16S rRNA (guanine966-N2)-methyltransferase
MQSKKPGSVRIIGGEWRGRRLPVPDIPGLRPSGDRSRETLFNWLQPYLRQAQCLDLFAGTGVLGLEAISRGAASVVLLEKSRLAAAALRASVELLRADQATVVEADALKWLADQAARPAPPSFDIAFVDPPFGTTLAAAALERLAAGDSLRPGGLVYLESAWSGSPAAAGPGWEMVREKRMGEVHMLLVRKRPETLGLIPDPA